MTAVDDRIVLPLSTVRANAEAFCMRFCASPVEHHAECLVPLIEDRDRRMGSSTPVGQLSEDCRDPFKHGSCVGCICSCHRPHRGECAA